MLPVAVPILFNHKHLVSAGFRRNRLSESPPSSIATHFSSSTRYNASCSTVSPSSSCAFRTTIGDISLIPTQLTFISKHLTCHYDLNEHNALLNGSLEIAPALQLTAAHDAKARIGEVTMAADLAPACKLELTSALPSAGLPKATLRLPFGEVLLEENEDQEEEDIAPKVSSSGIFKGQVLNGICNA